MMPAKMAFPNLLRIMIFWNKVYDVIIYIDDVARKMLSRNSNDIVNVFMWPQFGNCSISMRKVVTTQFYKDLTSRYKHEVLHQCGNRFKTKDVEVLGNKFLRL